MALEGKLDELGERITSLVNALQVGERRIVYSRKIETRLEEQTVDARDKTRQTCDWEGS
jgi:hypothetical protein